MLSLVHGLHGARTRGGLLGASPTGAEKPEKRGQKVMDVTAGDKGHAVGLGGALMRRDRTTSSALMLRKRATKRDLLRRTTRALTRRKRVTRDMIRTSKALSRMKSATSKASRRRIRVLTTTASMMRELLTLQTSTPGWAQAQRGKRCNVTRPYRCRMKTLPYRHLPDGGAPAGTLQGERPRTCTRLSKMAEKSASIHIKGAATDLTKTSPQERQPCSRGQKRWPSQLGLLPWELSRSPLAEAHGRRVPAQTARRARAAVAAVVPLGLCEEQWPPCLSCRAGQAEEWYQVTSWTWRPS
mmetsp:Transcript_38051/g.89030  ORF Transcript_38051/g.89030 Transcript_38051/m.89030 type:complete len:298 (-) Transcript_38051:601-1494(-)